MSESLANICMEGAEHLAFCLPCFASYVFLIVSCFPFDAIDKNKNQSSVSNADQEIPTLGSTDNIGNSVNLVSDIMFTLGLGFLGLHRRPMIDFIVSSLLFPFFQFGVSGRMWKKNGSVPEDCCLIFYARSITFRKENNLE